MNNDTRSAIPKNSAQRDTRAHAAMLKILEDNPLPMTELELREELAARRLKVNKTTVYRQLAQMKDQDLIRLVDFGDGKKRFELNAGDHHHHLVCTNCSLIEEIHMKDDLRQVEQRITKQKKFKILNHSLEFFGLCQKCQ